MTGKGELHGSITGNGRCVNRYFDDAQQEMSPKKTLEVGNMSASIVFYIRKLYRLLYS